MTKSSFTPRVFSGIKPSGGLQLGNYLGAIKRWTDMQDADFETVYCVVDLHAITVWQDHKELRDGTREIAAGMLAAGLTLVLGILRAKLLGPPWRDSFEVRTRAAIASVRSTEWIVESRPLKTSVLVVEGEVAVTGKASRDRVLLGPGMGTDVPLGGVPSPAAAWGAERVADVEARTRAR